MSDASKSSESKTVRVGGGIGFFSLLTVLFIGLKLTGHIMWSWFWVISPIFVPLTVAVGLALIALTIAAIGYVLYHTYNGITGYFKKRKREKARRLK